MAPEPQRRFRLNFRKSFFMEKVVMDWNRLPSEVVLLAALEVFKRHVSGALGDMV